MTYAVTSQDDSLSVNVDGVWHRLGEIKSIPEIGEEPEKLEATNLESSIKEYVRGIGDQNDLTFIFNAQPVGTPNGNIDLLMSLSRNGRYDWKWMSPRLGTQVVWNGEFTYKFGAGEVNSVRELSVTVIPRTRPIESKITATYTVTYNNNGGSGSMTDESSPYDNGAIVTIKENTFTPPEGKQFALWNTKADNSGDAYDESETFPIYEDTTLYAIWRD